MESEWRLNVAEMGLSNYFGDSVWEPFTLLARVVGFDDLWVAKRVGNGNPIIMVMLTTVDGQLTPISTDVMPPGSRFPFGWTVEPDSP